MNIFNKELNTGNIEYKLNLCNMSANKFQKYSTQLQFRILEGNGSAVYIIGVNDYGYVIGIPDSEFNYTINLFNMICENIKCKIDLIIKCKLQNIRFLIFKVSSSIDISNLPFLI